MSKTSKNISGIQPKQTEKGPNLVLLYQTEYIPKYHHPYTESIALTFHLFRRTYAHVLSEFTATLIFYSTRQISKRTKNRKPLFALLHRNIEKFLWYNARAPSLKTVNFYRIFQIFVLLKRSGFWPEAV